MARSALLLSLACALCCAAATSNPRLGTWVGAAGSNLAGDVIKVYAQSGTVLSANYTATTGVGSNRGPVSFVALGCSAWHDHACELRGGVSLGEPYAEESRQLFFVGRMTCDKRDRRCKIVHNAVTQAGQFPSGFYADFVKQ